MMNRKALFKFSSTHLYTKGALEKYDGGRDKSSDDEIDYGNYTEFRSETPDDVSSGANMGTLPRSLHCRFIAAVHCWVAKPRIASRQLCC